MQAKRDTGLHVVLIPDNTFQDWLQGYNPGWSALQHILQTAADEAPWDKRIPKLLFRGSNNTGGLWPPVCS